jgi:hypothetical protein
VALRDRLPTRDPGLADRVNLRLDCHATLDPHGVEAKVPGISVFKNGKFYHYKFFLDGRRPRGSTGTANKPQAIQEERRQREPLDKSYSDKAKVVGRWHDNRHTLVTELSESGAGDEVIMSIAGHVSRAMLSRYSHVRMEEKRRALDEISSRERAAGEKRKAEAERLQQAALISRSVVLQ